MTNTDKAWTEGVTMQMADSVRGVLQIIRGKTGATVAEVRDHCRRRGDDLTRWPAWIAAAAGSSYVTEQMAATMIFQIMQANAPAFSCPRRMEGCKTEQRCLHPAVVTTVAADEKACIEKCEAYLHGERVGSICGLRKLARDGAPTNALKELAEQHAGRADDCGRLARMALEHLSPERDIKEACTNGGIGPYEWARDQASPTRAVEAAENVRTFIAVLRKCAEPKSDILMTTGSATPLYISDLEAIVGVKS
jgi:hypothetical protein